eukprot:CAMPEP_0172889776 /NCGR_PEP_ID=MMETSP1075-20121228/139682_1 /TAXON_ID=2916 /ORGANISM="Ceratium fusus, Strain PA161109" /LENGTH=38 /DNA_ID= /DNA_START= /DNA_END= /DNA_ORIENTATION=
MNSSTKYFFRPISRNVRKASLAWDAHCLTEHLMAAKGE